MSVPNLQPSLDLVARSLLPVPLEGQAGAGRDVRAAREEPAFRISLSAAGQALATEASEGTQKESKKDLSQEEKQEVEKLKKRDREVRAHEAAHKAAAGSLSRGGPSFSFTSGPDGRRYATGGEVSIDTSKVSGDPDATVRKMQQVRAAALAPASPSGQDRKVAAQATAQAQTARAEAAKETTNEPNQAAPQSGLGSENAKSTTTPENSAPAPETAACAVCGGEGHGPEGHRRENTPALNVVA